MDILKYIKLAEPYDFEMRYTSKYGGMVDIKVTDGKYGAAQSISLERIQNSMGDIVETGVEVITKELKQLRRNR